MNDEWHWDGATQRNRAGGLASAGPTVALVTVRARRPTRTRGARLLAVAGSILLLAGIVAGLVNRTALDGPSFARHVDVIRRDPAVARQLGQEITRRVLAADPDLIALPPLIEATATSLAASPAFSPVVRVAVRALHRAFTDEDPGQIVFRLADVGAVLAGVVPALSARAAPLPPDLDVTLARVGDRGYAARAIHLTWMVGVMAWLLPLLGLLAFAGGLWLAPDRLQASLWTGWAVLATGIGVGLIALVGAIVASMADDGTLRGALVASGLRSFEGGVWWAAGLTVLAGVVVVAAATGRVPRLDFAAARHAWARLTRRPTRRRGQVGRGAALALLGATAVLRPGLLITAVTVAIGLGLLTVGIGEIAAALGARRSPTGESPAGGSHAGESHAADGGSGGHWAAVGAAGTALGVLLALVAANATPAQRLAPATASETAACNGYVELCSRRYDDVAFPAAHNAMSAADEPGWFIPEQPTGLIGQLDAGIRVLLIDSWYGQSTQRPGLIATAPGSHAAAAAEAERLYGREAVASAKRLAGATVGSPTGPVRPYLCHGLCEIGATSWEAAMVQVRAWLAAHPREVVTFFIEDSVSPTDTAEVFQQAGLLPAVHTQLPGRPWPTLQQMIDTGRRVVVLMERHGGGSTYPWLLQGFDWVQDTPYSNPTAADLSCSLNRGLASNPLLLVNNWLSNFGSLVSDAETVNSYDTLLPYLTRCRQARGRIPNYVAVNFYNQGDLFRVVDRLNGLP